MPLLSLATLILILTVPNILGGRCWAFDEGDLEQLLEKNSCRECDLRGADLREAKLRGADLVGSMLQKARLGGAKLDGARLE